MDSRNQPQRAPDEHFSSANNVVRLHTWMPSAPGPVETTCWKLSLLLRRGRKRDWARTEREDVGGDPSAVP